MVDFYQVPDEKLSLSLRNFRNIIKNRGWKNAKFVYGIGTCVFATRPDGKEIRFSYGTPPTTSYGAGNLADDKFASYLVLKDIGVEQPETVLIMPGDDVDKILEDFLQKNSPVVIKPIDGSHGNGVHVGIKDLDEAKEIVKEVQEISNSGRVLVQKQLFPQSFETRVICIDYKFVKAFSRIPACVTGDGKHTISELIDIENTTKRTEKYKSNLSFIDKESAVEYLRKQAISNGLEDDAILNSVPAENERTQVVGTCNTGQGGTMEDVTDSIPVEQRKLSEKIARHLELPLVGVDFLDQYVIEVNKAPALFHPVDGEASTFCIEKIVEYLEKIPV